MRSNTEDQPVFSSRFDEIDYFEKQHEDNVRTVNESLDMATKQWDALYETIVELAERHKNSTSFRRSQIGKRWFAPVETMAKEAGE